MKDLVIVGKGGFAREVRWLLERKNQKKKTWNFLGYVDRESGTDVIGNDEFLLRYTEDLDVVLAVGDPGVRRRLAECFRQNGHLYFPSLVDPGVLCSDQVHMGMGNIICAGTILTVDIEIRNFIIINLGCTIGHDTIVKDYVTINPGVNVSGNVCIEEMANIGTGAQIIQGKTVGISTIVGAGAVVNRTLPSFCTAVGVPARPVKFHDA